MTYRFALLTKQDIGKEKVEDKESQNRIWQRNSLVITN